MNRITILKLLLSGAMLWLVLRSTRTDQLFETLSKVSIMSAALLTLGYVMGQCLSTLKWWVILKTGGLKVSVARTFRAYFIGMFVNCFGFGTIGGDVSRALIVSAGTQNKAEALSSVLADRLHGLSVLGLIGLIATIVWGGAHGFTPVLIALCIAVPLGWVFAPRIVPKLLPEGAFKAKVIAALLMLPQRPLPLMIITVISLVFHTTQMALHLYMAHLYGALIPIGKLLTSVPFVNIASTLPISWNGLGVREQAYKFFLVPDILSIDQAVGFGALWLVAVTASSAIGGLVSVITGSVKNAEDKKKSSTAV